VSPRRRAELHHTVQESERAYRTFVESNLRLVISVARKYPQTSLPLIDLIQEGNIGLMHAVGKFDWRKGFKFSTYASWWIRRQITQGIADNGRTLRLSAQAGERLTALNTARFRLRAQLGRPPTVAELAAETELTPRQLGELWVHLKPPRSLDVSTVADGGFELHDVIVDPSAPAPDEAAVTALLPGEVDRMLGRLNPRERVVLRLRFGLDRGEPRTLEEVGRHFNLTRETIRQIEKRALTKLRHPSLTMHLANYVTTP
jgi:RNA polymerase sigma factor (sigma-70 family)